MHQSHRERCHAYKYGVPFVSIASKNQSMFIKPSIFHRSTYTSMLHRSMFMITCIQSQLAIYGPEEVPWYDRRGAIRLI